MPTGRRRSVAVPRMAGLVSSVAPGDADEFFAHLRRLIVPTDFSEWGVLRVRMGKAMKGSPSTQRTALTVFEWSVDIFDHWARAGPRFGIEHAAPLFPTETGGRKPAHVHAS